MADPNQTGNPAGNHSRPFDVEKIKIPNLDDTNYKIWSKAVLGTLKKHKVDQALVQDMSGSSEDSDAQIFLLGHVSDKYKVKISDEDTAFAMWKILGNVFSVNARSKLGVMRAQLSGMKQKIGENASTFVMRVRRFCSTINQLGGNMDNLSISEAIIHGLRDDFMPIYANLINSMVQNPDLESLEDQLVMHEEMLRKRGVSFPQQKDRDRPKANFVGGPPKTDKRACWECGQVGHLRKDCPRKKVEVPMANNSSLPNAPAVPKGAWLIDSGASHHVCNQLQCLQDLVLYKAPKFLTVANGERVPVLGEGVVTFFDEEHQGFSVSGVLYAPSMKNNLFSRRHAAEEGLDVRMNKNGTQIFDSSDVLLDSCATIGHFDYLTMKPLKWVSPETESDDNDVPIVGSASNAQLIDLIHRRLGHLSLDEIEKLRNGNMVTGLNLPPGKLIKHFDLGHVCVECAQGKMASNPYPASGSSSSRILELVHMDLIGPVNPSSHEGHRYVAVFLDDYSRFSIVKFLKSKAEAPQVVVDTLTYLENQTGQKIKILRSDRGTEYTNKKVDQFCKSRGIQQQYSVPNSPQQNGRAERLNRTLVMKARSLLADSKLSQEWWVEAVLNANLLRNCSPSANLPMTPYEAFWGKKPDVSYFRVFGSTALVLIPKKDRTKFGPVTVQGVMIGYDSQSKAYRILVDGKIVVSRDVRFNEAKRSSPAPIMVPPRPQHRSVATEVTPDSADDSDGVSSSSSAGVEHVSENERDRAGPSGEIDLLGDPDPDGEMDRGNEDNCEEEVPNLPVDVLNQQLMLGLILGEQPLGDLPELMPVPENDDDGESATNNDSDGNDQGGASDGSNDREDGDSSDSSASETSTDSNSDETNTSSRESSGAQGVDEIAAQGEAGLDSGIAAGASSSHERRYPTRVRTRPDVYAPGAYFCVLPECNTVLLEPNTFQEAMSGPDAEKWFAAMLDEINSLKVNGTWTLVARDPRLDPKAIPTRWVFKVKLTDKGEIERYKARLVAKGFKQVYGVDYTEVYAPVSKHTTLRVLLFKVASEDLHLHQVDIKTAFLNGVLEEEIYVKQPPGFEEGGKNVVCRLHKALYGLKQAPRAWHQRLAKELEELGFVACEADPGLYVYRKEGDSEIYLLVYVDDMLIASPSLESVTKVKESLGSLFDLHDLGEAKFFLGMEIIRGVDLNGTKFLKLSSTKLVNELLAANGLADSKGKSIPLDPSLKVSDVHAGVPLSSPQEYSEILGSLLYLANTTRPDIAFAVCLLSRYRNAPTTVQMLGIKSVLKYLAGTRTVGLVWKAGEKGILGFCDSDYAGDISTRKSTTGWVFLAGGGAVCWSSKRQQCVTTSTVEAEYVAMTPTVKEAIWLRKLLVALGEDIAVPKIYSDNTGALSLLKNVISSPRTKHIDVAYHFAREAAMEGKVDISYIPSEDNAADMFTKVLPRGPFCSLRDKIGAIA